MKYIKEYFESHKKILLFILLLIIVLLPISYLLASYATNVLAVHDGNNEYTITITEDNSDINIEAHSSVVVYYKMTNTNKGIVNYAIGYTTEEYDPTDVNDTSLGVYVKGYDNNLSGLINQNETKFIKLKIFNQTDNDDVVNLTTILGYETGGNLIVPEGVTLIDSIITEASAVWYFTFAPAFANTNIPRNSIATITIANDSVVPAGYTNYMVLDSVQGQNKSIVAWWKPNDNNSSLIDLYVGSDYGKVYTMPQSNMMFAQLGNATSLDLANLDTSHTIDMQSMFYNSSSLTSLDLSSFDTSHVTNMKSMFGNCTNLTTIDLSSFNTASVNSMYGMFASCSSLTSLNLSSFNTGSVNTMEGMFFGCSSLTSLNLSNFNTGSVNTMEDMFYNCTGLTSLNLSNFNTGSVNTMEGMFSGCSSLTSLNLSNFNTSNVESMLAMFSSCSSLTSLNLSNFNTSKVTNMQAMFYNCTGLTSLNLSNFTVKANASMQSMFHVCSSLNSLDIRNMELSNTTLIGAMFTNMPSGATVYVKNSTEAALVPSRFNVVDVTTLSS